MIPVVASGVIGIHAKRAMKHDRRFKGSDFVHLDVVENGVHVHDADVLMVPHGHDRWRERTVSGFYGRGGGGKCFSPVNAFQHNDDILKSSVRSNVKLINESPSGAGGNPSAKDRFRVGNKIKGFRRRRGAFHRDLAGNVSAVGDRLFGVGPDRSSQKERDGDDQGTSHVRRESSGLRPQGLVRNGRYLTPTPNESFFGRPCFGPVRTRVFKVVSSVK